MSAVAVGHEEVHERARQQQHERQRENDVGPVLGEAKVQRDRTQDEQADGIARTPEGCRADVLLGMVVVHSSPLMKHRAHRSESCRLDGQVLISRCRRGA